jgi:hypothetical protein
MILRVLPQKPLFIGPAIGWRAAKAYPIGGQCGSDRPPLSFRRMSKWQGVQPSVGCWRLESSGARAGEWPERPVAWIVPFPAGGGSDLFARPIAAQVADRLGQTMVIDNRSGAGGTLGTAIAARAVADGYTVLVGDTGLTYAPTIYPRAGFDFDRDQP